MVFQPPNLSSVSIQKEKCSVLRTHGLRKVADKNTEPKTKKPFYYWRGRQPNIRKNLLRFLAIRDQFSLLCSSQVSVGKDERLAAYINLCFLPFPIRLEDTICRFIFWKALKYKVRIHLPFMFVQLKSMQQTFIRFSVVPFTFNDSNVKFPFCARACVSFWWSTSIYCVCNFHSSIEMVIDPAY